MVLALFGDDVVRLGRMNVLCGKVGRVVVNEVADVAAKSAETSVTPETAGMVRALTSVQVLSCRETGTAFGMKACVRTLRQAA